MFFLEKSWQDVGVQIGFPDQDLSAGQFLVSWGVMQIRGPILENLPRGSRVATISYYFCPTDHFCFLPITQISSFPLLPRLTHLHPPVPLPPPITRKASTPITIIIKCPWPVKELLTLLLKLTNFSSHFPHRICSNSLISLLFILLLQCSAPPSISVK